MATAATFLVILAVLSWRMAAGEDPALGAGDPAGDAKTASTDPGLVQRRIVQLKVVHDPAPVVLPETDESAPAIINTPAPAVSTPAPATVTSAPAPAPAPAPAAPVTSSS